METLTRNAGVDSLSDQDYMDILEELLQTHTLRELVVVLKSQYSFGHWASMRKRERAILRPAKNELRVAMRLPPLPPTIAEAMAIVDENAEVYRTGQETPNRVHLYNLAESAAHEHGQAVAPDTWNFKHKNERVFNMSRGVLAWKIKNREEYVVA